MAAVISDFVSESSHYRPHHTMRAGSGPQHSPAESYRSRSRAEVPPNPRPHPHPHPQLQPVQAGTPPPSTNTRAQEPEDVAEDVVEKPSSVNADPPSPPSSSSPNPGSYGRQQFTSQQNFPISSAPYGRQYSDPQLMAAATRASPSDVPLSASRSGASLNRTASYEANTIKVRDLAHIQSFASDEFLSYRGQTGRRRSAEDPTLKYEISGMPITDIIEMVAGLLTKITTTNDRQHESLHRPLPSGENSMNMSGLSSSVLAFHGKNVPSITILSYLSRIHKYCPTTYEVFLSLLVYFDRMTERVNAAPTETLRQTSAAGASSTSRPSTSYSVDGSDLADSPPPSRGAESRDSDVAIEGDRAIDRHGSSSDVDPSQFPLSHFFVVDSFNIHRLVIAGVTCASKFFSDVFYTNSRYAKVSPFPVPAPALLNPTETARLRTNKTSGGRSSFTRA